MAQLDRIQTASPDIIPASQHPEIVVAASKAVVDAWTCGLHNKMIIGREAEVTFSFLDSHEFSCVVRLYARV